MTEKPEGAILVLKSDQQQIDEDGVFVGVSRQALDEVLRYFACTEQDRPTRVADDDPTTFTHVEDAHGYEVAVEFREGPSSSGQYLYFIVEKHKSIFGGTTCPAGEQRWFRPDGTCPGYPHIHLIRKDTE